MLRRVIASQPTLIERRSGERYLGSGMIIARIYWNTTNQRWQGQYIGWAD